MNDDVKAAVEWLRSVVRAIRVDPDIPGDTHETNLLAHIDGEPARQDAAREEQREACAQSADDFTPKDETDNGVAAFVRATPLTATPLADRIAELEERDALLVRDTNHLMGQALDNKDQAKKAEARVAELEREAQDWLRSHVQQVARAEKAEAEAASLRAERDALRAQVEAARAALAIFADAGFWSWEYRWSGDDTKPPFEIARGALAAMDGAKAQGG